ncbi:MAG: DUF3486 family protein [Methylobacter sp.]|nr:DUF3486 family protein [Methylobacter sp.]MDP2169641.1 DUF3486 family protein [Rhodocyclaceae bacterium]MDP2429047.1 DUF3486 family protein [Methylobacter sp.]MDP3056548.1 DUF3486 family protein [Methylobacter sp.]MDP3362037.1 DUF3486 family protein [Methylobacter sp.]
MPPRSPLDTLPEPVLTELNQRLVANGFSGYIALADWLTGQGYSISKSSVHRHGSALQASMEKSINRARERMEIAKALRGASDEDKAALMEANEMVAMDQIMDLFDASADLEPAERLSAVPKLVRAIADLNRSAIGSSKWKREFEAEIRRQEREESARLATTAAKAEGVSEQGVLRIREALGFVV